LGCLFPASLLPYPAKQGREEGRHEAYLVGTAREVGGKQDPPWFPCEARKPLFSGGGTSHGSRGVQNMEKYNVNKK